MTPLSMLSLDVVPPYCVDELTAVFRSVFIISRRELRIVFIFVYVSLLVRRHLRFYLRFAFVAFLYTLLYACCYYALEQNESSIDKHVTLVVGKRKIFASRDC